MKLIQRLPAIVLALVTLFGVSAASDANRNATAPAEVAVQHSAKEDEMRIEGEKRFRANCGRCHQSPHKFPPRMMLTVERHMRVRALVTDEDMKLIVHYLTQ
jgi:mono/diheme cytochrome c family protein